MEIVVFLVKKTMARIAGIYKKPVHGWDHYLTSRLWNDF